MCLKNGGKRGKRSHRKTTETTFTRKRFPTLKKVKV